MTDAEAALDVGGGANEGLFEGDTEADEAVLTIQRGAVFGEAEGLSAAVDADDEGAGFEGTALKKEEVGKPGNIVINTVGGALEKRRINIATRVSNSVADNGPFAFLGANSKSQYFVGFDLGGFYDFFHTTSLDTGIDVRFSDLHANNAALHGFNVGLRVAGHPFTRPIKPYVQASFGYGTTKAPNSTVTVKKVDYGIFGGVDYTLARHLDFRAIEVGYGSLTTVSSATVGAGGNIAIPASKLVSFSSGLVFRF